MKKNQEIINSNNNTKQLIVHTPWQIELNISSRVTVGSLAEKKEEKKHMKIYMTRRDKICVHKTYYITDELI